MAQVECTMKDRSSTKRFRGFSPKKYPYRTKVPIKRQIVLVASGQKLSYRQAVAYAQKHYDAINKWVDLDSLKPPKK
jgi:hypothetical protein